MGKSGTWGLALWVDIGKTATSGLGFYVILAYVIMEAEAPPPVPYKLENQESQWCNLVRV